MNTPMTFTCPTPCDPDCDETLCHEAHAVRWRRDHQPQDCPRWDRWYGALVANAIKAAA